MVASSVSWPSGVPIIPRKQGYAEKSLPNKRRAQVDEGKAITRRKFTKELREFTVLYRMTAAERALWDAFWVGDCEEGNVAVDWVHPLTGEEIMVEIRENNGWRPGVGVLWDLNLVLEEVLA